MVGVGLCVRVDHRLRNIDTNIFHANDVLANSKVSAADVENTSNIIGHDKFVHETDIIVSGDAERSGSRKMIALLTSPLIQPVDIIEHFCGRPVRIDLSISINHLTDSPLAPAG